jgi:carbamoyltransferase
MATEMETLVIGDCLLNKRKQDPATVVDYKDQFDLD